MSGELSQVRVAVLGAAVLAAGAGALLVAEPGISFVDALYLSVVTLTTIGYGDVPHPSSFRARAAMAALAFLGVGFFGDFVGVCHAVRMRVLDGAVARAVGLGDAAIAAVMVAVNVGVGVALCSRLASDEHLPSNTADAVYWSVITGTSVGYGDYHPTTPLGKALACAYALFTLQSWADGTGLVRGVLISLCTVPAKAKED